jgi:hypothetical protein
VYYDACLPCSNGTFSNDLEGATVCTACPRGTFQRSLGSSSCDGCPAGRFMNSTGDGFGCDACPRGRSTNGETGLEVCTRCSEFNTPAQEGFDPVTECKKRMQCGKVGGTFHYQDQTGSPFCEICENSRRRGGYGCDEESGDIQCYGLYIPESKCRKPQRVIEGLILASVTFVVSIFFIIPLVFVTGFLALVARLWRRDLSIVLQWMKVGRCVRTAVSRASPALLNCFLSLP